MNAKYQANQKAKALLPFLFFMILATIVSGQYFVVSGYVGDDNGSPLTGANVYYSNDYGDYTDTTGYFAFQIPEKVLTEKDSIVIRVSYIGYASRSRIVKPGRSNQVELSFRLSPSSTLLETVVISTDPRIKFKSRDEWILDFEFQGEGLIFLTKKGNTAYLKYQDQLDRIRASIEIPHQADRLEKSCMGDLHVIGEPMSSQVSFIQAEFEIVDQYPSEQYLEVVAPCQYHTEHGEFIFGHYQDFNQSRIYRQFKPNGKLKWKHHVFHEKEVRYAYDEFKRLIALYEEQVASRDPNVINYDYPMENVLDDQSWNGDLMELVIDNLTMRAVSYFRNVVLKKVYAPLFVYHGEVIIFDQLNQKLFAYQLPEMNRVREIPLPFMEKTGVIKEFLQDVENEKIYAKTTSGRRMNLLELNPFDGTIIREHVLPVDLHFERALKLRDGILYYIAQPHQDKPQKQIYMQKI